MASAAPGVLSGVVRPRLGDFTVKSGAMCRCLDAVWTLSGRCLDALWTLSGQAQDCLDICGSSTNQVARSLPLACALPFLPRGADRDPAETSSANVKENRDRKGMGGWHAATT